MRRIQLQSRLLCVLSKMRAPPDCCCRNCWVDLKSNRLICGTGVVSHVLRKAGFNVALEGLKAIGLTTCSKEIKPFRPNSIVHSKPPVHTWIVKFGFRHMLRTQKSQESRIGKLLLL